MRVVYYTEFPCNVTSHPYYTFCEGSDWGNEEATVACREQGYLYGIGGECILIIITHLKSTPLIARSYNWHGKHTQHLFVHIIAVRIMIGIASSSAL